MDKILEELSILQNMLSNIGMKIGDIESRLTYLETHAQMESKSSDKDTREIKRDLLVIKNNIKKIK